MAVAGTVVMEVTTWLAVGRWPQPATEAASISAMDAALSAMPRRAGPRGRGVDDTGWREGAQGLSGCDIARLTFDLYPFRTSRYAGVRIAQGMRCDPHPDAPRPRRI